MKNEFKESMGKILNSPIPENPKHKKVMNDLDSAKKQIFLETVSLVEERRLTKNDRISSMSRILDKINSEIDKRDFSDIPTDKLIMLGVKIQEYVKEEIQSTSIEISKPFEMDFSKKETIHLD
jgi:hypothetical protein